MSWGRRGPAVRLCGHDAREGTIPRQGQGHGQGHAPEIAARQAAHHRRLHDDVTAATAASTAASLSAYAAPSRAVLRVRHPARRLPRTQLQGTHQRQPEQRPAQRVAALEDVRGEGAGRPVGQKPGSVRMRRLQLHGLWLQAARPAPGHDQATAREFRARPQSATVSEPTAYTGYTARSLRLGRGPHPEQRRR